MCKVKKIVQRNLPLDTKYRLIDIKRGSMEDGEAWVCENCNKVIVNIATVQNLSTGKTHLVGLDCADTLTVANTEDYEFEKYCFNSVIKLAKAVKEPTAEVSNDGCFVRVNYTNAKGKQVFLSESLHSIKKYFPELINQL